MTIGRLPDPKTVKSKGFTLRSAKAFVLEKYKEEGWEKVMAELDPSFRVILEGSILASDWNPFQLQVDLYTIIDRIFGKGDLKLCHEIGRYTAEKEVTTIHKATMRIGGLGIWMKIAGLMWGQYYSAGKMHCEELGNSGGSVLVTEFNPISKAFCNDLSGWIERVMELSGRKSVTISHPQCLLDGDPACVYKGNWIA